MFFPHIAISDHMSIWIIYVKADHYPNINITQTLKYSTAQKDRKRIVFFCINHITRLGFQRASLLFLQSSRKVSFFPLISVNRANKPRHVLPAKLTVTAVPKPQIIFPSHGQLFLYNLSCSKLFRQHGGCTTSHSGFCSLQMGLCYLHWHKNIINHVVSSSGWLESVVFLLGFSCPFVFATIAVHMKGKRKKNYDHAQERKSCDNQTDCCFAFGANIYYFTVLCQL